jgi:hypothetical protein
MNKLAFSVLAIGALISFVPSAEAKQTARKPSSAHFSCYSGQKNNGLTVCFDGAIEDEDHGTGSASLKGRGTATKFTWERTTKNILLKEEVGNCVSGIMVVKKVLLVENESGDCGIPSGRYIESQVQ